ncbi:MAG: hypothetical protein ACR2G4_11930 [Pyrinomonadaceae bacterium]
MPTISLTNNLKDEYQRLFNTCIIRLEKAKQVETILSKIEPNRNRYAAVGDPLGIP